MKILPIFVIIRVSPSLICPVCNYVPFGRLLRIKILYSTLFFLNNWNFPRPLFGMSSTNWTAVIFSTFCRRTHQLPNKHSPNLILSPWEHLKEPRSPQGCSLRPWSQWPLIFRYSLTWNLTSQCVSQHYFVVPPILSQWNSLRDNTWSFQWLIFVPFFVYGRLVL